ncbi:hypothetical protein [Paenibacillus sp. NEAU-GSW1]|uniref:hypothetical protein n=1 Tax=Paenibacillus sp. NEAU-GSW1 TaxID=2682486 RepID=UPI001C12A0F6|nr:hypothetical protein [Paenibacillus sp. NEAU-GSW1]
MSELAFSYIEFSFSSLKTFHNLSELFAYIKLKKQKDIQITDLEQDLLLFDFFGEQELNYFWWPTEQERKRFWDEYVKLPLEERDAHLAQVPWDYETVFSEIGQGEYEIVSCNLISNNRGRLSYCPHAFPYGGVEPLIEAIKCFGAEIIKVSDWKK